MNFSRKILVIFITVLLSGCVTVGLSLYPLYTHDDLVFDPGLLGQWSEGTSEGVWHFEKAGERKYKLTIAEESEKVAFEAHLLEVQGHMFLDLFPYKPEREENSITAVFYVPVHLFFHVKQIEPTLQMRLLDEEWLEKFLGEYPDAISYAKVEEFDRLVLTAPTSELQEFLITHIYTKDAFGDFSNMERLANNGGESG